MTGMTQDAEDSAQEQTPGKLEQIIAAQVRHYRVAQGLSSAELAGRIGVSKAMISRVETATTSCSLTTLQRLADGLKVPVTALFRGADTDRDATFTKNGQGSLTVRSGTQHGHVYRVLGTLKGRSVARASRFPPASIPIPEMPGSP